MPEQDELTEEQKAAADAMFDELTKPDFQRDAEKKAQADEKARAEYEARRAEAVEKVKEFQARFEQTRSEGPEALFAAYSESCNRLIEHGAEAVSFCMAHAEAIGKPVTTPEAAAIVVGVLTEELVMQISQLAVIQNQRLAQAASDVLTQAMASVPSEKAL